jgi:3-oxoacyl-[acyl-carrier-protein] synthase II
MTAPREDGLGVLLCIEKALQDSCLAKEKINYINAHATSTLAGDLCEVRAIKQAFGPHAAQIKMNSTKSMTGHALGAAGGIEAVAVIQAIRTGTLHPNINLDEPEEELAGINVVGATAEEYTVTAAMSNSFGFGGHNSTLIFAPY